MDRIVLEEAVKEDQRYIPKDWFKGVDLIPFGGIFTSLNRYCDEFKQMAAEFCAGELKGKRIIRMGFRAIDLGAVAACNLAIYIGLDKLYDLAVN